MSEPDTEAYSASKGGIVALTHALAASLGPDIRVNCISPGWIDVSELKKRTVRHKGELNEADHAQHLAGRVGVPSDVAELALFLSSPKASFITAANFIVDGGMTRKMNLCVIPTCLQVYTFVVVSRRVLAVDVTILSTGLTVGSSLPPGVPGRRLGASTRIQVRYASQVRSGASSVDQGTAPGRENQAHTWFDKSAQRGNRPLKVGRKLRGASAVVQRNRLQDGGSQVGVMRRLGSLSTGHAVQSDYI